MSTPSAKKNARKGAKQIKKATKQIKKTEAKKLSARAQRQVIADRANTHIPPPKAPRSLPTIVTAPDARIVYWKNFSTPWTREEAEDTRPEWQREIMRDPTLRDHWFINPNGGGITFRNSAFHTRSLICAHSCNFPGSSTGANACLGGETRSHGSVVDRAETNGCEGGVIIVERGATAKGYSKVIGNVLLGRRATLGGMAEIHAKDFIGFLSGVMKDTAKCTDFILGSKKLPIPYTIEGAFGAYEIAANVMITGPELLVRLFATQARIRQGLEAQR